MWLDAKTFPPAALSASRSCSTTATADKARARACAGDRSSYWLRLVKMVALRERRQVNRDERDCSRAPSAHRTMTHQRMGACRRAPRAGHERRCSGGPGELRRRENRTQAPEMRRTFQAAEKATHSGRPGGELSQSSIVSSQRAISPSRTPSRFVHCARTRSSSSPSSGRSDDSAH